MQCRQAEDGTPRSNLDKFHHQCFPEQPKEKFDPYAEKRLEGDEFHQRRCERYCYALLTGYDNRLELTSSLNHTGPDWLVRCPHTEALFYIEVTCPVSLPTPKNFGVGRETCCINQKEGSGLQQFCS